MFFNKKKIITTDDLELLALYRQTHDKYYVGELFKKYSKVVLGTCAFYLEDREEAKDTVIDIFNKLMEDLKKHQIENFKAWLSFVTKNHCISIIRKRKTNRNRMADYYEFEKQETTYQDELVQEKIKDEEITAQFLKESLNELKDKQRICVEQFYLQSKTYFEIADNTGYSVNEVKSYIQNGKRNLKILIEEKTKLFTSIPRNNE